MPMLHDTDVLIVGGGLVGASLALALAGTNLHVTVVEARPEPALAPADDWDNRLYAISPGTRQFLQQIGAWDYLPPSRLSAIEHMHIVGDDPQATLDFMAADAGVSQLATVLESRTLQAALLQALASVPQVQWQYHRAPVALQQAHDHVALTLADGHTLRARLLVGADGARSWVRQHSGIDVRARDYQHSGVVANFRCQLPHHQIAHQWFRPDGVLAYLPLPAQHMSMVWSTPDDHARQLLQQSPADLADTVAAAGGHRLGQLTLTTPAAAFPLQRMTASTMVQPRLALIGDAAHTVHPLAGQGVNLGFMDARELAGLLRQCAPQGCGDYLLLRRYARARAADVAAMQWLTDTLHHLFQHPAPPLRWLRNQGLRHTNRLGPIKRALMQQAFG
jgi:2-octaprenylphenol hydroxylase